MSEIKEGGENKVLDETENAIDKIDLQAAAEYFRCEKEYWERVGDSDENSRQAKGRAESWEILENLAMSGGLIPIGEEKVQLFDKDSIARIANLQRSQR